MRILIVRAGLRFPREDCEWASRMIVMFGRRPRANRHHTVARDSLGGILLLALVGVCLTALLFTF